MTTDNLPELEHRTLSLSLSLYGLSRRVRRSVRRRLQSVMYI